MALIVKLYLTLYSVLNPKHFLTYLLNSSASF